jgi:hypothetical protein
VHRLFSAAKQNGPFAITPCDSNHSSDESATSHRERDHGRLM